MSEILTIRLAEGEKTRWEKAAAREKETVAEYVRKAVRERVNAVRSSPWDQYLGSADVAVPPPTNLNIRRALSKRRRRKR